MHTGSPDFSVNGLDIRAIREEERQECLDLWCTVWPGEPEGSMEYFRRYFYGDREFLPYYTRVGVVDGKIVSAVQICKRIVACGDHLLTMGGIANVATLPEYRGKGYNTQCLRSAIAVMEADAMDFSLLFTGIHPYYERQDFETLEKLWLSGTVRGDFVAPISQYRVRPATVDDLDGVQRCYSEYNSKRPFAVQRYRAYWRDWMNIHSSHIPETLLVATDATETVVGYIQTGVFKSAIPYSADAAEVRVIEYGALDLASVNLTGSGADEQIAVALLAAVVARMQASNPRILRLEIAPERAVYHALGQIVEEVEEHTNRSGMVRLLHRENLFRSMTMDWNDRWLAAGRPPGRLLFDTPYGAVSLDATGSLIRIGVPDNGDDMPDLLSQSTFLGLLFGMLSPDRVTENESLHPLISTLFPLRACVYYGADGF